jgi:hypothetical protein
MTELSARELIDVIVRSLRETARRFAPKRARTTKKRAPSPMASARLQGKKKPRKKKPSRARRRRA